MQSPNPCAAPAVGGQRFVSQSECSSAIECGVKWFGTWWLGHRPNYPENMPQRVGSMGHAILNDRVHAVYHGRDVDPLGAADAERAKRGWGDWNDELEIEAKQAEQAADTLADAVGLDRMRIVPNTITADGGPLAEVRAHATWAEVSAAAGPSMLSNLHHLLAAYRGMEGQPDLNVFAEAGREEVTCYDFKLRQKPDLGGAHEDSALPDPQGAFYKVLLRAKGIPVAEFKQINVYAGPWLTVEDFMAEGSAYVRLDGTPSKSLNALGAMVKPAVWAEAWRLLVERKRIAHSLRPVKTGKRGQPLAGQEWKAPDEWDAMQFVHSLETYPLVAVRSFRLDMSICRDVVRDMLAAVDGRLAHVAAKVAPSRNLRTFPVAPCVKRYGCPVQDACRASLGTGNVERVMREQAEAGALATMSMGRIGVLPAHVMEAAG